MEIVTLFSVPRKSKRRVSFWNVKLEKASLIRGHWGVDIFEGEAEIWDGQRGRRY